MGIFDTLFKKKTYDLDTLQGIESIEIPVYKRNKGIESPVNNIEYILQRKATEHKRNGRMDLAIACLRKSNEIFPHSNFLWSSQDYSRLVEFLKQAGRFDEARTEEEKINNLFKPSDSYVNEFEMLFLSCKQLKTDLVISSEIFRACAECGKYSKRIFSVFGKDKRFPPLPQYFALDLPEHIYCFSTFYPFSIGYSDPGWKYKGNLVNWCNRPFVDERTKEQRNEYRSWVMENEQEIIDRKNFDFLREHLPAIAPKSFGGFRRMKNLRSSSYLKLHNASLERGINLNEVPDLSIYHF